MKRIILAVLALTLFVAGNAQAQDQYLELMRSDIRTQVTAIVTEAMQLDEAQGEAFWPIYREYELAVSKLGDQRIALIKKYVDNYMTMDNAMADEIIKDVMKLNKDRMATREKYYKQINKAIGGVLAARFWQVDGIIQNIIDLQVSAELPIIEHTKAEPVKE
jgi:hypothetical protein